MRGSSAGVYGTSGSQPQLRSLPLRVGLVGLPRMRAYGGILRLRGDRWTVLLLDVRQRPGCPVYVNSCRPRSALQAWPTVARKYPQELAGNQDSERNRNFLFVDDPTSLRLVASLLFCAPAAKAITARERSSPAYAPARAAGTLRGRRRAGRSRRPARQACLRRPVRRAPQGSGSSAPPGCPRS